MAADRGSTTEASRPTLRHAGKTSSTLSASSSSLYPTFTVPLMAYLKSTEVLLSATVLAVALWLVLHLPSTSHIGSPFGVIAGAWRNPDSIPPHRRHMLGAAAGVPFAVNSDVIILCILCLSTNELFRAVIRVVRRCEEDHLAQVEQKNEKAGSGTGETMVQLRAASAARVKESAVNAQFVICLLLSLVGACGAIGQEPNEVRGFGVVAALMLSVVPVTATQGWSTSCALKAIGVMQSVIMLCLLVGVLVPVQIRGAWKV